MSVRPLHLQAVVLALGLTLIGYGLIKAIWKVDFGPWIEQNLSNVVIVAALGVFLWNRQLRAEEQKKADAKKKADEALRTPDDPKTPGSDPD